jgi:DNA-binding GntR family transcriptional regulator
MNETRRIRWTSEQSRTLPERIADAVRVAILRGDLQPGAPIHVGALARNMKVSPGPLREALRTLSGEGLVEYAPRHGVMVRNVEPDERREMGDITYVLDSLAFHDAAAHMTPEVLAEAERLHERLRAEPDPARWLPILIELRHTLLAPSGRPHLLELILTLRARSERVNRVLYSTPGGREAMIEGWREIIDAMRSGDPERVLDALASSLRRVRAASGLPDTPLPPRVSSRAPSAAPGTRRAPGLAALPARPPRGPATVRQRGAR